MLLSDSGSKTGAWDRATYLIHKILSVAKYFTVRLRWYQYKKIILAFADHLFPTNLDCVYLIHDADENEKNFLLSSTHMFCFKIITCQTLASSGDKFRFEKNPPKIPSHHFSTKLENF